MRTGRFILSRNGGVIYVGELLKGNEDWKYSVTEDQVRSAFGLITESGPPGTTEPMANNGGAFMKKILVLEDEASIRSFIVINLRRAGTMLSRPKAARRRWSACGPPRM